MTAKETHTAEREFDSRATSRSSTNGQHLEFRSNAAPASDYTPDDHTTALATADQTMEKPCDGVSHDAGGIKTKTYLDRASDHLKAISPPLGIGRAKGVAYRVSDRLASSSSGATAVHAQQEYLGILVFQASEVVRFAPNGALESTAGQRVPIDRDYSPEPKISSVAATRTAVQFVATPEYCRSQESGDDADDPRRSATSLTAFSPAVVSVEPGPERRTFLGGEPFTGTLSASLVWFGLEHDLRLAWEIVFALPAGEHWRVVVDAANQQVLYSKCLTLYVTARGPVYTRDGGSGRQLLSFPQPLTTYGLPVPPALPAGFPRDWVAGDRTEGNAVNAHLRVNEASLAGANVDGVLTFNPASDSGNEQRILNLFYLCNYMHDYLYLLGFREADGNFQQDNFSGGGAGADSVDARAFPVAVAGTANWSPDSADGTTPVTNMGLAGTGRHTAFDSGVVFHEYTHGLTTRLVGGYANTSSLDAIQSASMGEGWGDYIACTINKSNVIGAWVMNNPQGFRQFPYDTNFPDHYGLLGTGRYNEVHNNGEIWCAALMELNRRIGPTLAVQCVVDGLKLTPGNPTYLQARDAILAALGHKAAAEKWKPAERRNRLRGAWSAFAKFGMGLRARSGSSWTTAGIVADFTIPGELDTVGPWAADFVGAPRTDVLFNKISDGGWSLGSFTNGQLLLTPVANTFGFGDLGDGQHPVWLGDFAGTGKTQILFNYVGDGNWWLGSLIGLQLTFAKVGNTRGFGDLADGRHPSWVGDFTGSGKTQILFNYSGDGNWWLGTLVNGQLSFAKVGNTHGFGDLADGGHLAWVGDFTGSGKAQVLFNYVGDGNWWLGSMNGGQFLFAKIGNTHGFGNLADGKHPSWSGKFTGTGKDQVLFNYVGDGNWWLGSVAAGQLTFAAVGNTRGFGDLADGKHPSWVGDFSGSSNTEILFNYVGDGNWWLGSFANGSLAFSSVGNTAGFGDLADGAHPALIGDFAGSNKAEILFNYFGDGNWWLGSFNVGKLTFSKAGTTGP
jgi:extracellular elastinolytic metalloproteinase